MKIRIDELLVLKKLAGTRSQAKQLIQQGVVKHQGIIISKPAQLLDDSAKIVVTTQEQYVGRGAYKLKAAIEEFEVNINEITAADIGASTGGFTDYLLQNGAKKVYAIDVGHSQLASHLVHNPHVVNLEKTNIKDLKELPEKVDLVVIDLSFISIRHAIPNAKNYLKNEGKIIALFKPQFEVGSQFLGKDGVLKDSEKAESALREFSEWSKKEHNIRTIGTIKSPITGKKGNQEYLVYLDLTTVK
ncbi:TlyA family rRNA (cytidine-2'-O)-methyltransferase [Candidatus Peregrinibacteria bacterium CG10_big_fil_rev_8_21_14_0_10_36_19]|nr:MAG: TlyA family rRNA (cytidine-2'-O)-methyltransferase [Candidatus Peregrinibacteria bacterium CG10_big_fil_rev_8_21_14_0_10_36_19]